MLRTTLAACAVALVMATAASAEPCADCDPGGGGGGGGVVKPTAAFTYDNNKLTQTPLLMTSMSTGTITSYDWDFGDGSAHSTVANTAHDYAKGGVYHVTLTVGNSAGTSSVTHDVTIQNRSPVAFLGADRTDVMTGETVHLDDGGYDLDGDLVTWAWEFGDGDTSSERFTSHSYAKSGTYTVKLTEWDDQGAGAVATQQIVVHNRAPQGAITYAPQAPVAGQPATFGAGATDPDGTVASYAWDFGAAGSSNDAGPQVTFAAAGTYPVKVTITDDEGAQTTLSTTVTVKVAPVAELPVTAPVDAPPVSTPVTTPLTTPVTTPVAKPVKKASCNKKVRHVVKKVHGKRKKVKKLACVKPKKKAKKR